MVAAQAEIIIGDALATLRTLPAESVQCVVTSPPYWGLRDYGVAGQIGLEPTPAEYVARMVEVLSEVRRVLRADGVLWLNLGDSYVAQRGGGVGENSTINGKASAAEYRKATSHRRRDRAAIGKHKDMVGIPWRVALALQADGWWLRSDCIWHKPNPMPEAVTDRPTKAHEYVFLLSRSARYFWDRASVAEAVTGRAHSRGRGVNPKAGKNEDSKDRRRNGFNSRWKVRQNPSFSAAVSGLVESRNLRTVWTIPTQPFSGAHFATFPEALAERCIRAGSRTGDLVLDPFAGAGTTGVVALRLGRRFLGIELNPEYAEMACKRIAEDAPLYNRAEVRA